MRATVSSFTSALLSSDPPIPGLDQSIIIPARRLHLTLGVMSLANDLESTESLAPNASTSARQKSLQEAIMLLENIKPRIVAALKGQQLRVPLSALDVMPPERNDHERAHHCFVGPRVKGKSSDKRRLQEVCGERVPRSKIRNRL